MFYYKVNSIQHNSYPNYIIYSIKIKYKINRDSDVECIIGTYLWKIFNDEKYYFEYNIEK